MRLFFGKKGLTFLEIIISTFWLAFMVTATMNLITSVYKHIYSTRLKTFSFNLCEEHMEIMRTYTFGGLKVTPDSMLPEPLSNLESSGNPWGNPADADNIITIGGTDMKVYKLVQWAEEDIDGNISPIRESDIGTDEPTLKMMKIIVTYTDANKPKRTELFGYMSHSGTSSGGIKIKGLVQRKKAGAANPPGLAARVSVYVEGKPEYTAVVGTESSSPFDRGFYTIYNVVPGTYYIYAQGDGFKKTYYTNNPVVVTEGSGDIGGVNIICDEVNPAQIAGTIYEPDGSTPVNPDDYEVWGREIRADDGTSSTTTVNSFGQYLIDNIDPDVGSVIVTAVFTNKSTGENFYGTYPSSVAVSSGASISGVNITLLPVIGTGILRVKTLSASDMTSPIPNVNVLLTDMGSGNTFTAVSDGSGSVTMSIPPGTYRLSGALANYRLKNELTVAVTGNTAQQKLYLYAIGAISGTIINEVNGDGAGPINVIVKSGGVDVASAISNTLTGTYLLEDVPTGSNNDVRIVLTGTKWVAVNPEIGQIANVTVSQGTTTPNQNMTVKVGFEPIFGRLTMNSDPITDGVLMIAQPMSNTVPPHAYNLAASGAFTPYKRQNTLLRKLYPSYGVIAERDGSFRLDVPKEDTYTVYAYYNYVTWSGSPIVPTLYKSFSTATNLQTGDTVTFNSWSSY